MTKHRMIRILLGVDNPQARLPRPELEEGECHLLQLFVGSVSGTFQ